MLTETTDERFSALRSKSPIRDPAERKLVQKYQKRLKSAHRNKSQEYLKQLKQQQGMYHGQQKQRVKLVNEKDKDDRTLCWVQVPQ